MFRVLSWGKGVQSTTLAAMSAKGVLPRLDAICHSDLEWERQRTYEIGDWYERWLGKMGCAVEIVRPGNIRLLGAKEHIHMPFWTETGGPLRRQCTRNFKINPIKRHVREIIGYHPSKSPHPPPDTIELWIGISWDEAHRMNQSDVEFIRHRWPLIELKMTRQDCIKWLEDNGLPIPVKSACIGCPYRSASEWLVMREEAPDEFDSAVEFDECNRCNPLAERGNSTADKLFIFKQSSKQPIPLADADLEAAAAKEREGVQLPLLIWNDVYRWPE